MENFEGCSLRTHEKHCESQLIIARVSASGLLCWD
jgi:hypothetical protein